MVHTRKNKNYNEEDITEIGYHYYMTPETAAVGSEIFKNKKDLKPESKGSADYRDIRLYKYYKQSI